MKKVLALVAAVAAWGAVNSYGQGNNEKDQPRGDQCRCFL